MTPSNGDCATHENIGDFDGGAPGAQLLEPFSTELVTTLSAFAALEAPWNELVTKMGCPEIFYLWDWNFHFFRHYRKSDRLMILVVRDSSGGIAAIAPFCVRNVRRFGCLARVVETIVGEIGDFRNILVHSAYPPDQIISVVLGYLREQSHRWDVIDISDFCSRDATTFHIVNAAQAYADWSVRTEVLGPIAVLKYKAKRIAQDTRRLRRVRNRLKTLTQRGFHCRIGCTEIAELWPIFSALHRAAWPASPFNSAQGRAFFDDLIKSDGMRGKIEISLVEYKGQPVAMHFGFVDRRKVYFYMPAMDRSFRQERVGAVLLSAMVDHYAKTHEVFDFMRGTEDYKNWYTDNLDINVRIVAYRTLSSHAFAYNMREATKRFAVDLGLPKAIVLATRRILAKARLRDGGACKGGDGGAAAQDA